MRVSGLGFNSFFFGLGLPYRDSGTGPLLRGHVLLEHLQANVRAANILSLDFGVAEVLFQVQVVEDLFESSSSRRWHLALGISANPQPPNTSFRVCLPTLSLPEAAMGGLRTKDYRLSRPVAKHGARCCLVGCLSNSDGDIYLHIIYTSHTSSLRLCTLTFSQPSPFLALEPRP